MSDNKPKIVVQDFQAGYLTLPFEKGQFKEFVSSLLGQPQTINKIISGQFEIHLKDLQNFNDLIDQRITQQNNGALIQLKTQIFFSDNSSVLLSSLNELLTYNEVKPIISEKVTMTWGYLIQFADKTIPEKQEIELTISTKHDRGIADLIRVNLILTESVLKVDEIGHFEINIRHTARSWGNDIETLLTNQINSILLKDDSFKLFIANHRFSIVTSIAAIISFAGIYSLNLRNEAYLKEAQKIVAPFIKNNSINDKVNYLINFSTTDHTDFASAQFLFCCFLIILISIIFGVTILEMIDFKNYSFIVLTRESKKNREDVLLKQRKQTSAFIISYLGSIIASIIAGFIYAFLTK